MAVGCAPADGGLSQILHRYRVVRSMDVFFSSVLLGAGLLSDNFSTDGLTSPFPLIPRAILPVTAIGVSKDDLFG